jgi:hypothetical protein
MEDMSRWFSESFAHLQARWQEYVGPTLVFFGVIFGLVTVISIVAAGVGAGVAFGLIVPAVQDEMDQARRDPFPVVPDGQPGTDPTYPDWQAGQGSQPPSQYPPPPSPIDQQRAARLGGMMVIFWIGYAVFIFIISFTITIAVAPLQLRFTRGTLSLLRGGKFAIGDLFRGEGDVGRSIGLMVLLMIVVTAAMPFFYFPALLLGVLFMFSFPIMADRKVGPIEAMKLSMEITKKNYWVLLLYMFVGSMITSLLSMVPIIGSLAAVPVMMVMFLTAYRSMIGETPSQRAGQPVQPQGQLPGQALAAQENQARRVTF